MLSVVGLAVLIALPQLWVTFRYYPTCVRVNQTAQEKQALGSIPLWQILKRMVSLQRLDWVDGVAPSETQCYPGVVLLVGAVLAPLSWWHGVLGVALLLAMGRHTPLFRWTHRLHLRLPCRYLVLVNLTLILLGVSGWASLSLTTSQAAVVTLLGAWEMLVRFPSLSPTTPYCQRWMTPSEAMAMPVLQQVRDRIGLGRVMGLPYPHRTGLLAQLRTLGYNGATRPRWMATLRPEEGNHEGEGLSEKVLDELGVTVVVRGRQVHERLLHSA